MPWSPPIGTANSRLIACAYHRPQLRLVCEAFEPVITTVYSAVGDEVLLKWCSTYAIASSALARRCRSL